MQYIAAMKCGVVAERLCDEAIFCYMQIPPRLASLDHLLLKIPPCCGEGGELNSRCGI
jgi:hypothetical protein